MANFCSNELNGKSPLATNVTLPVTTATRHTRASAAAHLCSVRMKSPALAYRKPIPEPINVEMVPGAVEMPKNSCVNPVITSAAPNKIIKIPMTVKLRERAWGADSMLKR